MRHSAILVAPTAVVLALLTAIVTPAPAQYQPPAETLIVKADELATWSDGETMVVQADSPVTIETDRATLSADRAVAWITPARDGVLDEQIVELALIGNAKLVQHRDQVTRSGDRLFVTARVRANIRVVSEHRVTASQADSDLYRQAARIRPLGGAAAGAAAVAGGVTAREAAPAEPDVLVQRKWIDPPPPTPRDSTIAPPATAPSALPRPREPVSFRAHNVETIQTADDKVAFVLSGGVSMHQRRANGDLIELRASNAVVYTQLRSLRDAAGGAGGATGSAAARIDRAEDAVEAAYLEGDVRIQFTPAAMKRPEQQLQAERVYYEFSTDRAVLTQAVIHSIEPERQIPITVRAATVRQLSIGEYHAERVELSTSQFATPTYSVRADRAYVRQSDTGDDRYGTRTTFRSVNSTFHLFGVPFFWLPYASGSITEQGMPLRNAALVSTTRLGFGARTEWGLFETLGATPPQDLDIAYQLDWFEKRGFALGTNGEYKGGYITDTTKEPWDFKGRFTGYLINDHGEDKLGADRLTVEPPESLRGRVLWEHQHFFPGDWQVQLRAGFSSDATFLEEFFEREFDTGQPHEASAYVKRQRETEAMTLLVQSPTNDFTTTANELQEQVQILRLPELGYRRIGDSFAQDKLTFVSTNSVSVLRFEENGPTLEEQGFRPGQSPGIPSYATTGTNDDTNLRGDFRQEVDYPFSAGQFKVVPYVFGRWTGYTDTPGGGSADRWFVGTGVKLNTAFWRVDDTAQSRLFDVNRLRHVIEPEVNFFTSAQTVDQSDLFIYDEPIDAINDVTAVQLALHQRWQTKRGGAGRFRSVDFFCLNVEANLFFNQPSDTILNPTGFRGLYFPSLPETSVARNSINADALWRISDTTVVLADCQYNLDEESLATTSIGLAAQREPRTTYFAGVRYIGELNSTIATISAGYDISTRYALAFTQSFNLSDSENQDTSVTVVRRFDRLMLTVTMRYDAVNDESGFAIGLAPEGLGVGFSSDALDQTFGQR